MSLFSDSMNELEELMNLIAESSLPSERKAYWLEKLRDGTFGNKEREGLKLEIDLAVESIDREIAKVDEEIAKQQKVLDALNALMVEKAKEGKEEIEQALAAELRQFEKEVAEIEKQAIEEVEKLAAEKLKNKPPKKKKK